MPTAYCPIGGSAKLTVFRKNASGICTKTPAPSPVSGSDPVPPRCAKRDNISSASCTIACERSPFTCAINPVPHASCSNSGRQSFAFCQVFPARKEEALAVRPVFGATSDSCKSLPRCRGSSALQGCISCCFIFHLLIYTFPPGIVSADSPSGGCHFQDCRPPFAGFAAFSCFGATVLAILTGMRTAFRGKRFPAYDSGS